MADQQIVQENGRVSLLFRTIWAIATGLILSTVVGIFVKIDGLKEAQYETQADIKEIKVELKAQSTISTITNGIAKDERTALSNRLAELERRIRRDRDDS